MSIPPPPLSLYSSSCATRLCLRACILLPRSVPLGHTPTTDLYRISRSHIQLIANAFNCFTTATRLGHSLVRDVNRLEL
jgi:hypothetical protein